MTAEEVDEWLRQLSCGARQWRIHGWRETDVFPEGRAVDATCYSSDEGMGSEDQTEEDEYMHNETVESSSFKAWDYAAKCRDRVKAKHWESRKGKIHSLHHSHGNSPSSLMWHPLGHHTLDYDLRHSSMLVLYA